MKLKPTILKLIVAVMIFTMPSCETKRMIFTGPYFVSFTKSTETELESYGKPIQIEIHNAGPALEEDALVSYSISGNARENIDYKILGTRGLVTIPKGEYFGYIQIQLIDNANNILRSQDIDFTITSVSGDLQVGLGDPGIGKEFTFTIKDDCILGGIYRGYQSAFSIPTDNIKVTSTDCETYALSNWNIDVFAFRDPLDLTFIDNGDNTLTIPDQEQNGFPSDLATINGIGSVNPLTREMDFTITLVDFDGKPEVSFTLTPD